MTTEPESIEAVVERVTFHSRESGFVVLRVRPRGPRPGVITVVGSVAAIAEGERIVATGVWREDREYGRQFSATTITSQPMQGRVQIETFLGSGAIRGVGPSTAHQMLAHFGDQVLDVLDNTPQRLEELPGIGAKRAEIIAESWAAQRATRELGIFLANSGLGVARAGKIHKRYGSNAIRLIQENPYQLVRDIHGVGFATADALALKLGLQRDSQARLRAGLTQALVDASMHGHCGLPEDALLEEAGLLLAIPLTPLREALALEVEEGHLIRDVLGERIAIFLPWLARAEENVTRMLRRLVQGKPPWPEIDSAKALEWVEQKTGLGLAPSQRAAVDLMLHSKVCVITGGPGVGKTTIVNSIVRILEAKKVDIVLVAPTGRAARRLAESTNRHASTIHRILQASGELGDFIRNEDDPIDCDMVIVDEASMIDLLLMQALLRALPPQAALLLVGDVDQLPAVGPGQVLSDIIDSGVAPVLRLTEIFRQSAESRIVSSAHEVNQGRMPALAGRDGDFYFWEAPDSAAAADRIVELVGDRIPKRFGFDPLREIQVLAPMRVGAAGVEALNGRLQARLNPAAARPASGIERAGAIFHAGDKVMQTVNDYEKGVFNGDSGIVVALDVESLTLTVDFDGRAVEYNEDGLDDLVLAYATTVHKSQGSEYPAVVIALTNQQRIMLQRNLLYTAITRGKQLVVIVGQEAAMRQAVLTTGSKRRWTRLAAQLAEGRTGSSS